MLIHVVIANCWDCNFVIGVMDVEPSEPMKTAMLQAYYKKVLPNAPQDVIDKQIDLVENISVEKHHLLRQQFLEISKLTDGDEVS